MASGMKLLREFRRKRQTRNATWELSGTRTFCVAAAVGEQITADAEGSHCKLSENRLLACRSRASAIGRDEARICKPRPVNQPGDAFLPVGKARGLQNLDR
jgi:hypothetical protein